MQTPMQPVIAFEIRVKRDRPLKKGDMLSFFYPSTDWTLAQPFDCWCGAAEKCCGRIEGPGRWTRRY